MGVLTGWEGRVTDNEVQTGTADEKRMSGLGVLPRLQTSVS